MSTSTRFSISTDEAMALSMIKTLIPEVNKPKYPKRLRLKLVLSIMGTIEVKSAITLLSVGLICLSINELEKKKAS